MTSENRIGLRYIFETDFSTDNESQTYIIKNAVFKSILNATLEERFNYVMNELVENVKKSQMTQTSNQNFFNVLSSIKDVVSNFELDSRVPIFQMFTVFGDFKVYQLVLQFLTEDYQDFSDQGLWDHISEELSKLSKSDKRLKEATDTAVEESFYTYLMSRKHKDITKMEFYIGIDDLDLTIKVLNTIIEFVVNLTSIIEIDFDLLDERFDDKLNGILTPEELELVIEDEDVYDRVHTLLYNYIS